LRTQTAPRLDWPHMIGARGVAPDELVRALNHLRSFFGERAEALPLPLLERLLNRAPWTGDWLVWLSRSIRSVDGVDGYASLRDRLTNPVRFDEACSVLQVAERLVAAGLDIAFDQAVLVDGARKIPDLLVRDLAAGVQFHCEISVQYSAAAFVEQSRAADAVIESLLYASHDPVLFSGRFLRAIAQSEIDGLARRVQWELMEVARAPGLREIAIENMLQLAIAPRSHAAELALWAQKQGLQVGTFGGAGISSDELARLRLKIEDEAKQLPAGYANLVVISAQNLFIAAGDPGRVIEPVAAIIGSSDKVAVLVLNDENIGPGHSQARKINGQLLVESHRGGIVQRHLVVTNPACPAKLPPETLQRIYSAFAL
jgi:hypothetical protein